MKNFTTSNVHCPVNSYKLLSDNELLTEYDLLSPPVIQENFFTLDIPTGDVRDFEFLIQAEVLGGVTAISSPLTISVEEILTPAINME